jgi:hypothetical protein
MMLLTISEVKKNFFFCVEQKLINMLPVALQKL